MPWRIFAANVGAMLAGQALEQLHAAQAATVPHQKDPAEALRRLERLAFGE